MVPVGIDIQKSCLGPPVCRWLLRGSSFWFCWAHGAEVFNPEAAGYGCDDKDWDSLGMDLFGRFMYYCNHCGYYTRLVKVTSCPECGGKMEPRTGVEKGS